MVVVLGDLNARVGNDSVTDVIGKYGVPGKNRFFFFFLFFTFYFCTLLFFLDQF